MNYRNAKYIADGLIDCEINHSSYGWIPFTCDPTDVGAAFNTSELYATMNSDPTTATYISPTKSEIEVAKAEVIRTTRNGILANIVDPLVSNPLRWADLSTEKQVEWIEYRHTLLNVPQQDGFPSKVIWPIQPE